MIREDGSEVGSVVKGWFLSQLSVVTKTGPLDDECGIHGMKDYPVYRDY